MINNKDNRNNKSDEYTGDIDLVYLWCDASDPEFLENLKYWEEKANIKEDSEYHNSHKFKDNEELRYSLRSVMKNAPWIHKIYIVTNGQVPKWLDLKKNNKIEIITHKQIIPEKYLPTFSSDVIESFVANIPNLSEHFLLANDDCFISAPVTSGFFFDKNGNPIVRLIKKRSNGNRLEKLYLYHKCLKYSRDLINKKYKKRFHCVPHHNIDAYLKSSYNDCIKEFNDEFEKRRLLKFRAPGIHRFVITLYMVVKNNCKVEYIKDFEIFKHQKSLFMEIRGLDMLIKIRQAEPELLCINDSLRVLEEEIKNVKSFFQYLFPEKQAYEKDEVIEGIYDDVINSYDEYEKKIGFWYKFFWNFICYFRPFIYVKAFNRHIIFRFLFLRISKNLKLKGK